MQRYFKEGTKKKGVYYFIVSEFPRYRACSHGTKYIRDPFASLFRPVFPFVFCLSIVVSLLTLLRGKSENEA